MTKYLNDKYDLNDPNIVSIIDELPLWSAPFGLKLLDTIKLKKNISVLDIGFGLGFPIIEVAMRLGDSSTIYGIDPWEAAIERTKFKIKLSGIENIILIKVKAEELPLETNSIDLIISNNGINNVEDLSKVLSECNRVAKIGAQFVATINLDTTMIEFYNVFEKVLSDNSLSENIKKMKEHIRSKRKPLEETVNQIEASGFKINNLYKDKFYFRYIDGTTMLNHFVIKFAFLDSWKKIIEPEKQQKIFSKLEHELNDLAEKNGELKLTIPFVTIDSENR